MTIREIMTILFEYILNIMHRLLRLGNLSSYDNIMNNWNQECRKNNVSNSYDKWIYWLCPSTNSVSYILSHYLRSYFIYHVGSIPISHCTWKYHEHQFSHNFFCNLLWHIALWHGVVKGKQNSQKFMENFMFDFFWLISE